MPQSLKYCKGEIDRIENYSKAVEDKTQIWHCHHRLEIMPFSGKRASVKYLVEQGLYLKQPPEALIYLTSKDHNSLHHKGKLSNLKGVPRSAEVRRKISQGRIGKPHPKSDEWRRKHSEALKGRPSEKRGKHWRLVNGHRVWYS